MYLNIYFIITSSLQHVDKLLVGLLVCWFVGCFISCWFLVHVVGWLVTEGCFSMSDTWI